MPEIGVDRGHQSLSGLAEVYRRARLSDASEADTRVKVIDSILRGVLYWTESDITREERSSEDGTSHFVDYVLRTANVQILIEAKRAGTAFVLPNNRTSGSLGGWLSSGELGEAIRQARDYCRRKAVPFAVVTNGAAWIVFPAVRTDGVAFEDCQARVFRGIEDIEERFVEFWELLSRQRVVEGNLEAELLSQERDIWSSRLLSIVAEPGYRLGRNALYELIEPAVSIALSDESLLSDAIALEACYIKTSERARFDARLKMYLTDLRPPLGRPSVRVGSRKARKSVERAIGEVTTASSPKFILVLGPVGAGKTTFLAYTRNVSGRMLIENKLLWLYVDFKKATAADNARDFIYQELLRLIDEDTDFKLGDWEHTIRPSYRSTIDSLERGALHPLKRADPAEFERRISEMIFKDRTDDKQAYVDRILKRAISMNPGYLVIDNVDQISDDEAQSATFVEAQALAKRVGINVIMSLRASTYLRHRDSPAFNAFQNETIFVDPPSLIPVLSHRFAYAQHLLAGHSGNLLTEHGARVPIEDLGGFFSIISKSLLGDDAG
ncbi:MAG: type I restriction enzyme HsdR N-terminal domain-containing protein, partial [Nitrososphaera sp.]|nr:type I restriction enzyme HsdR N-terminal domain-containing protein [Nitrososphaera sp.]